MALEDVTAMRFILRQPSPEWRTFSLEEISVFKVSVNMSQCQDTTLSRCHNVILSAMQESLGSSAGPAVAADSHPAITKLEMLRRHTMDSLKVIIFLCGC